MGGIEECFQGELERYRCASAKGKEENRKSCLMRQVFDSRPGCGLNSKLQTATAT
jgi:hypothetical protein